MAFVNNSDFFLVNRDDVTYKVQSENLMAYLEDTDYMLINRSDVTLKINGADIRASLASGSPLSPAIPPFGGLATTETILASADGKVEFSLDGTTYSTNLTVPLNTFYYVDWGTDILSAPHGSPYSAQITATYSDLGTSSTIDFDINAIDKVPDPFSFTALTEVASTTQFESDIISPVETINAPAQIWVTSDAPSFELRVGDDTWFNPPAIPGSAYVSHNQEVQVRHTTGTAANTTYTTTVNIGYGTGVGEFESADFATTTENSVINTPSITSPSASDNVDINAIVITGSAIAGQNYGVHQSTSWQIAEDAGFNTITEESLNDTVNLTSYTSGIATDDTDRTLYLRFKYIGSTGTESDWSPSVVVSAKKFYTYKLVVRIAGGRGGSSRWEDDGNYPTRDGGSGCEMTQHLETAGPVDPSSVTESINVEYSVGSGGSNTVSSSGGDARYGGTGAAAKRFRLNGDVGFILGGAGGAGEDANGGSAKAPLSTNPSTVSNGGSSGSDKYGAGGAGAPGGAAGNNSGRGGVAGGSYAPVNGTVIASRWNIVSTGFASNRNDPSTNSTTTLERKYLSGGYTTVATTGGQLNTTLDNL